MGVKDLLFRWFKSKGKHGREMNLGYVLDGEPKTVEAIEKAFKAFNLDSKFQLFKPLIRPKIDFELTHSSDTKIKIGQSKIGGRPDLINKNNWPTTNADKFLSFIGQLNCEEVANYDKENLLPKNGLISFFYCADQEAWGFDPKDTDRFKVIFTENKEELQRIDFPKDLEEHSTFQPNEININRSLSLPGWEHDSINGILSDEETNNYIEVSDAAENQIFGYANCVQGPMELDCQLVTNGLYCGDPTGYNDPRRKELESEKDDWVLLLQIDSDEDNAGMMWGDVGKLYYWIRKQDLKKMKFEKSWFILQCH
jgi:uncharacterized protein YwqG